MKVDDLNINDKKKEILDKKRYEQMHKNYNQGVKGTTPMPDINSKGKEQVMDQG